MIHHFQTNKTLSKTNLSFISPQMTNSIMNSTSSITSITKSDDLMGINVILSPTIKSQTTKKAITNANFKTQLLPEDIPIITKQMSLDKK